MMQNAKDINPITVAICRDMFRYDANEIVQPEGDNNGDSKDRHTDYRKG